MRAGAKADRARELRAEQTDVERRLWSRLRDRRLLGLKFRRQVPVGPYIADFACIEHRLIVELDGGQHGDAVEQDEARTVRMQKLGWRVARFWNSDIVENLEGVLQAISVEIENGARSPHPDPLPQAGEGEE